MHGIMHTSVYAPALCLHACVRMSGEMMLFLLSHLCINANGHSTGKQDTHLGLGSCQVMTVRLDISNALFKSLRAVALPAPAEVRRLPPPRSLTCTHSPNLFRHADLICKQAGRCFESFALNLAHPTLPLLPLRTPTKGGLHDCGLFFFPTDVGLRDNRRDLSDCSQ